jgi:hypothetical protein
MHIVKIVKRHSGKQARFHIADSATGKRLSSTNHFSSRQQVIEQLRYFAFKAEQKQLPANVETSDFSTDWTHYETPSGKLVKITPNDLHRDKLV